MSAVQLPPAVVGLCDDAAVFPPGLAPLPDAVRAYRDRRSAWYADLVGPLVLADGALGELAGLVPAGETVPLSVTLPGGPDGVGAARAAAAVLPVELRSFEVAIPPAADPASDPVSDLDVALGPLAEELAGVEVYIEIPRDGRGPETLRQAARRGLRVKFRTGGARADLYPDEAELAASLAAAVRVGTAFKATAGLHRAVRHTDPATGFAQHGFLNVLLATDTLLRHDDEAAARALLAERDPTAVADGVDALGPDRIVASRAWFTSFGTCSITEPLDDLVALGLVTAPEGAIT